MSDEELNGLEESPPIPDDDEELDLPVPEELRAIALSPETRSYLARLQRERGMFLTKLRKAGRENANWRSKLRGEQAARALAEDLIIERDERILSLEGKPANGNDPGFKLGVEAALIVAGKVREPRKFLAGFREELRLDAKGQPVLPTPSGPILFASVVPIEGSGGRQPNEMKTTTKPDPLHRMLSSQKEFEARGKEMGVRKE